MEYGFDNQIKVWQKNCKVNRTSLPQTELCCRKQNFAAARG